MHIYSLEFFIEKLELGKDNKQTEVDIEIKCQDFLTTTFPFDIVLAKNGLKEQGSGKAIFFTCAIEKLISVFSSDIDLTVNASESASLIGSTIIKWKNFESLATKLTGKKEFVEDDSTHNLMMNGQVTGSLKIQMCIIDFGEQIEIPIAYIGSQLTIPLIRRRSTYRYTGAQMNLKPASVTEGMAKTSADTERAVWASLFAEARLQHKSVMSADFEVNVFADMSGRPVLSPLQSLLTPDYINKHLCKKKKCPGSLNFRQYGLGPLATNQYIGKISPPKKSRGLIVVEKSERSKSGGSKSEESKPEEAEPDAENPEGEKPKEKDLDDISISDLILEKIKKKRTLKYCCDTQDCPHGKALELPENETPPPEKTEEDDFRPKKCRCLNCGNIAKPVIVINTCKTPKCPKIQEDVPCPYQPKQESKTKNKSCCGNQRRLSAGADTCPNISEEATTLISSTPVLQEDLSCPYQPILATKNKSCSNRRRLSAGADTCLSIISEETTTSISSSPVIQEDVPCSYQPKVTTKNKNKSCCSNQQRLSAGTDTCQSSISEETTTLISSNPVIQKDVPCSYQTKQAAKNKICCCNHRRLSAGADTCTSNISDETTTLISPSPVIQKDVQCSYQPKEATKNENKSCCSNQQKLSAGVDTCPSNISEETTTLIFPSIVIREDVPCSYQPKQATKNKSCCNQRRLSAGADTCLSSISEETTSWISSTCRRQTAGADKYGSSCPFYSTTISTPQSYSERPNTTSYPYYSSQQSSRSRPTTMTYNANCTTQSCPYSSTNSMSTCHGNICHVKPEKCPANVCPSDVCEEDQICDGVDCPFQSENGTGYCLSTCPYGTCTRGSKKSKKNGAMIGELNKFLDKAGKLVTGTTETRKCNDKVCPSYQNGGNCQDPNCPQHGDKLEESGTCGGKVCPLEKKAHKSNRSSIDTKKEKRLSILLNENGKQFLLGKDELLNQELMSSLSIADDNDLYFMLSRLLADRKRTQSLNNYYNSDIVMPFDKMLATSAEAEGGAKKRRKGPCEKQTCKIHKYKTCEECGGITRSGATCDHTDVSFETISYDSASTPAGDQATSEKEDIEEKVKVPAKIPVIKKKSKHEKQEEKDKMAVKIVKPKKRRSRFAYSGGENYPGYRAGHKVCIVPQKNVPAQMGWLWNIKNEGERKRKKNWKPGVIRKDIEERIIANRRAKGIPDPPELKMLVRKKVKAFYESDSEEEEVVPKPTLLIQKKEGNYLITMNPLKDPKKLVDREDPYMRCKPIQFLITRPKKTENLTSTSAKYDEIEGEYEGEEEYEQIYKDDCLCDGPDNDNQSSSSESELNIEFTTPAGIILPERFKKPPNVVNEETQFKEAHFHCNDCPIVVPAKYKKDRRSRKK